MLDARQYRVQTKVAVLLFELPQQPNAFLVRANGSLAKIENLVYVQSRRCLCASHILENLETSMSVVTHSEQRCW